MDKYKPVNSDIAIVQKSKSSLNDPDCCQVIFLNGRFIESRFKKNIFLNELAKNFLSLQFAETYLYPISTGKTNKKNQSLSQVLFIQLGNKELDESDYRKLIMAFSNSIIKNNIEKIAFAPNTLFVSEALLSRGVNLLIQSLTSFYSSLPYKSKKQQSSLKLKYIYLISQEPIKNLKKINARAKAQARAIDICRYYADLPSNRCTPIWLAKHAKELLGGFNTIKTKIYNEKQLEKMKMGCILGVGRGSANESCLLQIEYKPKQSKKVKPIVLVGKGVTFDTGGISLKPSAKMDEMKYDMCGGATVIATMHGLAEIGTSHPVVGLVPLVENMPGGNSINPGDILTAYNKKTIEVLNTDAEGRLILADALSYADKFKPRAIVDLATLTGACIVALGKEYGAVIGNNQELVDSIIESGVSTGDNFWQLPLAKIYQKHMDSRFADIANIGRGGEAGTITAALFLESFVKPNTPWAHLDIAGIAWKSSAPKGATGRPVSLLMEYLLAL